MQLVVASTFPDIAIVSRQAYVDDGAGGQVPSGTPLTFECKVFLLPKGGSEAEYADRVSHRAGWIAKVPAGTDVRQKDTMTILGSSFEVLDVWAPRTYELYRRVVLSKID
jgi:hypothetical protein